MTGPEYPDNQATIALEDIHVEPHPGVDGTFIRMDGVIDMPSVKFLQSAVKGFPVSVYLDQSKEPLESIHAVDATMDWAKTEIGLIHISNLRGRFYDPIIYQKARKAPSVHGGDG